MVRMKERKGEEKPTRTAMTLVSERPHTDLLISSHAVRYSTVIGFCDPVGVHFSSLTDI